MTNQRIVPRWTLIELEPFTRDLKRLGLPLEDRVELEVLLTDPPIKGDVIAGGGGLRKVRFAPPSWGRGKSGATRVMCKYLEVHHAIVLVRIYGKNERESLPPREVRELAAQVEALETELARRRR